MGVGASRAVTLRAQHGVRRVKTSDDKLAEKRAADKLETDKLKALMAKFHHYVKQRDARRTRATLVRFTTRAADRAEKPTTVDRRSARRDDGRAERVQRVLLAVEFPQTDSASPADDQVGRRARARVRVCWLTRPPSVDPQATLNAELKFGEKAIARNPKSYWAWGHRVWLLGEAVPHANRQASSGATSDAEHSSSSPAPPPTPSSSSSTKKTIVVDWAHELKLCGKLLELDDRNCEQLATWTRVSAHSTRVAVHCWHYRRFVAAGGGATAASELAFTRAKIDQSFSNYSAWHQRALLLLATAPVDALLSALSSGARARARAPAARRQSLTRSRGRRRRV